METKPKKVLKANNAVGKAAPASDRQPKTDSQSFNARHTATMPKSENREVGAAGEDFAVAILEQKGHEIICRNYAARGGEIDIISLCGEYIVFTEVKLRRGGFSPMSAVTHAKIERVKRCAEVFLKEKGYDLLNLPPKVRIDIITLRLSRTAESGTEGFSLLSHIEGLKLMKSAAKRHG